MPSPEIRTQTTFVLDARGRIQATREPDSMHGPLFALVRGEHSCSWAVRDDIPDELAQELEALAQLEPPTNDFREPPMHARQYLSLLGHLVADRAIAERKLHESDGPAFAFPDLIPDLGSATLIDDEDALNHHFQGWLPGEIAGGRFPVMAIVADGFPVSVCCCARRSDVAAEAGLDTASEYRGRGFGPIVTAAWARAIRAENLIPMYSTLWSNGASLAVARKLGLSPYASLWKLSQ